MKVLLTGASGFVGRNVHQALERRGHAVLSVSRRDGHDMNRMLAPADWRVLLDGIGGVVNAAGILVGRASQDFHRLHTQAPQALFEACRQAGVRRVVQVSALGADPSAVVRYHRSKRAADDALLRLDLDATVLRPSLIYGRGGTSASLLLRLAALPLIPLPQAAATRLQPVHVSDVVATVLRALTGPARRGVLDVVGPRALSLVEWLRALRAAQGLAEGRFLTVPDGLAIAAGWLLQPVLPLAAPDTLRMLQRSVCADGSGVERFLGRALRAPEPRLQFEDAGLLGSDA